MLSTSSPSNQDAFPLTDDHRMLLRMRETLYEGIWEDFVTDLQAKAQDRPHVFQTVPTSDQMKSTIKNHLEMIATMEDWESQHEQTLSADDRFV